MTREKDRRIPEFINDPLSYNDDPMQKAHTHYRLFLPCYMLKSKVGILWILLFWQPPHMDITAGCLPAWLECSAKSKVHLGC